MTRLPLAGRVVLLGLLAGVGTLLWMSSRPSFERDVFASLQTREPDFSPDAGRDGVRWHVYNVHAPVENLLGEAESKGYQSAPVPQRYGQRTWRIAMSDDSKLMFLIAGKCIGRRQGTDADDLEIAREEGWSVVEVIEE